MSLFSASAPPMVPDAYRDAAEAVRAHLVSVRGGALFLSPADTLKLLEWLDRDVPLCFNRKEVKDHGEGGDTLGAPLNGRVLIVDDVISAGTSVNESVEIIRAHGATPVGVMISLDRQERGSGTTSAAQEVEQQHGIPVGNIVALTDIVGYLEQAGGNESQIDAIVQYRERYGVN